MRRLIPLIACALLAACAHPDTADNGTQNRAPVTDASAPAAQNPAGEPQRPLTDLPSLTLAAMNGSGEPGEAFFENTAGGIAVRVLTRASQPGTTMQVEIDRAPCSGTGPRVYALQPLTGASNSVTVLHGTALPTLRRGDLSIRVLLHGKAIDCGMIGKDALRTR